jgi:hypothetical protein
MVSQTSAIYATKGYSNSGSVSRVVLAEMLKLGASSYFTLITQQ